MRFELSRLLAPIEADLVVLHRLKSIDRAQSDLPVSWILFRRVIGHDLAPRLLPERHQRVMHRFIHPPTTYSPQNKSISNIRSMNYHRKWGEERNSPFSLLFHPDSIDQLLEMDSRCFQESTLVDLGGRKTVHSRRGTRMIIRGPIHWNVCVGSYRRWLLLLLLLLSLSLSACLPGRFASAMKEISIMADNEVAS